VLYSADEMDIGDDFAHNLARRLQQAGLGQAAAVLLDAAGPLTWVAAQMGYLAEPLFGMSGSQVADMARLLEDPDQVSNLVGLLREAER
jgi:hypothetical protein